MNKEHVIVDFSKAYLEKLNQTPEIVLYIAEKQKIPRDKEFDKIVKIRGKENGYAYSTHVTNGILTSFFRFLESNLDEILCSIDNSNVFFAGLFDAEGNIFLEDACFRWSCKDKILKEIFKLHLKKLELFDRDDGINLVTYNKEAFRTKILPYLIHTKKINNSNLIFYKRGYLENRFRIILNMISERPGITFEELAKALKKKKVYAQVGVLEKLGYICSKSYPKRLYLNKQY